MSVTIKTIVIIIIVEKKNNIIIFLLYVLRSLLYINYGYYNMNK